MLPFKLFQSKQNLTWLFCILRRFLIRYGQLNFLLLLPCSHGLLVRLFIYLLSCQYRNPCKKLYSSLYFVALYFTRLLLSGFSLCITRIKNLFFWKEIDKTFCCFCFFKILKTFWNIRLKANQMSLDLRYLLFQTRRALTGYYTAHSY